MLAIFTEPILQHFDGDSISPAILNIDATATSFQPVSQRGHQTFETYTSAFPSTFLMFLKPEIPKGQ